jgi:hypothetical protein
MYLSLPYDPEIGYINALPLLRNSMSQAGFQARLEVNARKAKSVLAENGMLTEANFYSLNEIVRSVSSQQFPGTLLENFLFSEAQMVDGARKAGGYVAEWREREDPSPEEFRRAFAQFRSSLKTNVAKLQNTLKFWDVQSAPDPEIAFRRIMSAAGKAMAK